MFYVHLQILKAHCMTTKVLLQILHRRPLSSYNFLGENLRWWRDTSGTLGMKGPCYKFRLYVV